MKPRSRITLQQSQRLQLNLSLAGSIRLLQTDAAGLNRYLEEQAADNPYLTLDAATGSDWLPRWNTAFAQTGDGPHDPLGQMAAPSLMAHVMQAIDAMFPAGRARQIAIGLADALEPSGWIGVPLDRIAAAANATTAEVEAVLARLQQIEPTGLFARSLAECLQLQAIESGQYDPVMSCVLEHLDLVMTGDMGLLARQCDASIEAVTLRLRIVRRFDPKPGAQFDQAAAPVREPDLVATRGAAGWEVALNNSALPALRLNAPDQPPQTDEARAAWSAARDLRHMVEMRNATLLRVGREILRCQEPALNRGLAALQPLTMDEVAMALSLHESTISRVVAGTAVDTPRGTWWLRALFSGQVAGEAGASAAAVRAVLAQVIGAEDPAQPLGDAALVALLAERGYVIARRTLAKYRELLNIPPAHRRRRRMVAEMSGRDRKSRPQH